MSLSLPPRGGGGGPVPGSHEPRALRARHCPSSSRGVLGCGTGSPGPLAQPKRLRLRRGVREGLRPEKSCLATHRGPPSPPRPARLTLRSRLPSPHSHHPRRRPPWGPWRAPRRAPLAGTSVTWDALPAGRPAQRSRTRGSSQPASPRPGPAPANNSGTGPGTPHRALSWPRGAGHQRPLPPRPALAA